jgi:hypothetical protein
MTELLRLPGAAAPDPICDQTLKPAGAWSPDPRTWRSRRTPNRVLTPPGDPRQLETDDALAAIERLRTRA